MRILNFSKPLYAIIQRKIQLCLLIVFCLLPRSPVYSLPPQKILQSDDWAYGALAILSREQGRVFFADSRITVAQMENFLAEINPNTLSESGLAIYDRLEAYLKSDYWLGFESDAISGGMDLILQPEFYFKTNEDVPWIYDAHSRNPLILLPWGFSFGPWITAEMELNIGENEYAAIFHDNYENVPLDLVSEFDIHFPKRAYLSAGLPVGRASGINVAIGVGDNFFGNTCTGSVVISEYLERVVYARASVYSPAFKYSAEVMQYEVNKYHYMHYVQAKPHRTITVSIAEGVMANGPLELRFLNPFTIFHSHESYKTYTDYNEDLGHKTNDAGVDHLWDKDANGNDIYDRIYDANGHSRIGSYFGAKIEWQPIRYFRFYGLLVFDVLDLPMKKDNWMEGLFPDALGFQAGLDVSFPVRGGYWEFGLEGVYTYPYLYTMWDKGWSFYKDVPELDRGDFKLRYWTGSPYGPDTIAGVFSAGYRSFQTSADWYAGLTFEFTARGRRSDLRIFDTDEAIDKTYRPSHYVYDVTVPPTGVPIYTYTTSLRGEYYPRKWISIVLQPGYRISVNGVNGVGYPSKREEGRVEHSFEMALSTRFRPPVK